jgi:hypothetical protein
MNILAGQPIAGSEAANGGQDLVLKAFAPIEVALAACKFSKEIANQSAHRRVLLGSFDAGFPVDVIRQ